MKQATKITGFTILELIVVLFFFALISGLALPNLHSAYQSWQRKLVLNDLLLKISQLNREAINKNTTIKLDDQKSLSDLPFQWPSEWEIKTEHPIIFFANGVCNGGVLMLNNGNDSRQYQLAAPYCNPIII
ncbi:MAG: hypothetical protein COW84_11170 [Gammaproteobacteria bacterium CG22_combo_CG10-13_8_21_14_all_40_8]|nr:MAG: hypothetical protein COW84_11170 [Gammaproteobacteria bacterium CG22_combo_CG10-13_8_21_14_all_40_8]